MEFAKPEEGPEPPRSEWLVIPEPPWKRPPAVTAGADGLFAMFVVAEGLLLLLLLLLGGQGMLLISCSSMEHNRQLFVAISNWVCLGSISEKTVAWG